MKKELPADKPIWCCLCFAEFKPHAEPRRDMVLITDKIVFRHHVAYANHLIAEHLSDLALTKDPHE